MSDLQTQSTHQFDFNGFNLEVFAVDDAPWFIARPLAEYLGYQNPARDIRTNCDEWDIQNMYIPYKSNNYVCVNESGLYSLVLRSNKPEAKKFKKWVTSEVLPSIRKSGFYAAAKPDPVNLIQSVVTVFEGNLKLADLIGLEGNQRILSASKATQSLTGTDVLKLLNVPALTAPTQESLLTPSALGKELGLKPAATNKLLEAAGLQVSRRDDSNRLCWDITDAGKAYGIYLDTGKKNSAGTPIRQIKWGGSVLNTLHAYLVA